LPTIYETNPLGRQLSAKNYSDGPIESNYNKVAEKYRWKFLFTGGIADPALLQFFFLKF
jgi:hypothetical protein